MSQLPGRIQDDGNPAMRRHPMHSVRRLALKELREILRDRRTILTLLLMPLLVYPLVSLLFQRFLFFSDLPASAEPQYYIGIESPERDTVDAAGEQFLRLMLRGSKLLAEDSQSDDQQASEPAAAIDDVSNYTAVGVVNVTELLLTGEIQLGVRVAVKRGQRNDPRTRRLDGSEELPLEIELVYITGSSSGKAAAQFVEERIAAVEQWQVLNRLRAVNIPPPQRNTVRLVSTGQDEKPQVSHFTLLPLILILMTITGAVYPAIDLTAGERERGTLEMLVAAPISRVALLIGKYCAVLTVAILTATVNLIAMALTLASTGLGQALFGDAGITIGTIIQIFCLMILFAAFFSAVLLILTSFARSFKEAQAYLIPLMLLSLAPGIFSLMPSVELTGVLVVTPLVNIVLLARDMFDGSPSLLIAGAVIASTAIYALAAIALAARIFGTDAILYGSESSWGDLFRRPDVVTRSPSMTSALLSLAILFPLFF